MLKVITKSLNTNLRHEWASNDHPVVRTRHLYRWFSTFFRGVSRGVQLCHPVVGYSSTLTRERKHTAKILLQCVSSRPVAKPGDTVLAPETWHEKHDIWTDHDLTVRPMNKINLPPSFIHPENHPDKVSSRSDKPFVSYRDQCHEVSENVTTLKTYFAQTSMRRQFFFKQSSLPL